MLIQSESVIPEELLSLTIAQILIDGFDKHYSIFRKVSAAAKERFENLDWLGQQQAQRDRIDFYDMRVRECIEMINAQVNISDINIKIWNAAKFKYIQLLINHPQPELAETFFNSVVTKILKRHYYNNDCLFVRPVISTNYIEHADEVAQPTYQAYYPTLENLDATLQRIVTEFNLTPGYEDLDRDIKFLTCRLKELVGSLNKNSHLQLQVLTSLFYRNKAAYLIGKIINGHRQIPFALPILYGNNKKLRIDALLSGETDMYILFSFARAYFMVDMQVPSAYVEFLQSIMPHKPRAEIYSALGLAKQGKTLFYRHFLHHLRHSSDQFRIAPGIKGMVMLVFDLPSFPFVFKVIKDYFPPQKETTRAIVKEKYLLVKQHDRVGRMADTLEYSDVAFPIDRFDPDLLLELQKFASSQVEINHGVRGHEVVIRHVYIERRMIPLNIYLQDALSIYKPNSPEEKMVEDAIIEYGNAIKELVAANIFPGDMLWKNFGITRNGRVVFYDYDEIEYLTDCNFRAVPQSRHEEDELSSEVWYSVAKNDVFPETFGPFLLGNQVIRHFFMKHHADLLSPDFWRAYQNEIAQGFIFDVFPYAQERRFALDA